MVGQDFDSILRHLRIDDLKQKLMEEDICSVADLLMVSGDQCSDLGMVIGQRNRVGNRRARSRISAKMQL